MRFFLKHSYGAPPWNVTRRGLQRGGYVQRNHQRTKTPVTLLPKEPRGLGNENGNGRVLSDCTGAELRPNSMWNVPLLLT